jgi:hypothetical protein
LASLSDPFFVTAAIAGGASMISTSQNRVAVNQANSVNVRGQVLAAAVVHQRLVSMRPYMTRRTRLPFGTTPAFPESKRPLAEDRQNLPDSCDSGLALHPRLWARLVLSKTRRG